MAQRNPSHATDMQDWLMFTGGYGVGKTHLAAAIANYQAMRGYPAMFVVVPVLTALELLDPNLARAAAACCSAWLRPCSWRPPR